MNKEEILARSRSEAVDEGLREAESRGRQLGITAFGSTTTKQRKPG